MLEILKVISIGEAAEKLGKERSTVRTMVRRNLEEGVDFRISKGTMLVSVESLEKIYPKWKETEEMNKPTMYGVRDSEEDYNTFYFTTCGVYDSTVSMYNAEVEKLYELAEKHKGEKTTSFDNLTELDKIKENAKNLKIQISLMEALYKYAFVKKSDR